MLKWPIIIVIINTETHPKRVELVLHRALGALQVLGPLDGGVHPLVCLLQPEVEILETVLHLNHLVGACFRLVRCLGEGRMKL